LTHEVRSLAVRDAILQEALDVLPVFLRLVLKSNWFYCRRGRNRRI